VYIEDIEFEMNAVRNYGEWENESVKIKVMEPQKFRLIFKHII
jgi:hypothetical protein